MNEFFAYLASVEKTISALYKTFRFFYFTKMAIPWTIAFFFLIYFIYEEVSDPFVPYIAYIILGFSALTGIVFFVLMIFSMNRDLKEIKWLRELHLKFTDSLEKDYEMLSPGTIKSFGDFQRFFNRVCPKESTELVKKKPGPIEPLKRPPGSP